MTHLDIQDQREHLERVNQPSNISEEEKANRKKILDELKKSKDLYLQELWKRFEQGNKSSGSMINEINSYKEVKKYMEEIEWNNFVKQLIEESLNSISLPSSINAAIKQGEYSKITQICNENNENLTEKERKLVIQMAVFYLSEWAYAWAVLWNCEEYKAIIIKVKKNPDDKWSQLRKAYVDNYRELFQKNSHCMIIDEDYIDTIIKLKLDDEHMDAIIEYTKNNPSITSYEIYSQAVNYFYAEQNEKTKTLEEQL